MDEKFKKSCPNCCQQFCLKSLSPLPKSNIPLFLKCGHSVCEICVRNFVKCAESIECKICQRKMEITKTDIAMLIDNKILFYDLFPVNTNMLGELTLELIKCLTPDISQEKAVKKESKEDLHQDLQAIINGTETTKGQCLECHSNTNKKCQQCATIICEDCFDKSHKNFIVFKNHILQDIEAQIMINNCKIHSDKTLEYYCKDCNKSVCMDCFMVGSEKSCKNHNVVPSLEMNTTILDDLREISPQVETIFQRLTKTAVDIGHQLETIDSNGGSSELKTVTATIEQHFSQLHAKIQAHKVENLNIINKLKDIEKNSLIKAKDDVFKTLKDTKRVISSLKLALDCDKNKSINLLSLLEEAKSILTVPWYLSVEESNKDSLKVTVNDDLCLLISDYIHLDGNVKTLYKLRASHELDGIDIPPPPRAQVLSTLLPKDIKTQTKSPNNEKSEKPFTPREVAKEKIVNISNTLPYSASSPCFDAKLDKSKTLYENYSQRCSTPTSSKEAPPEGNLSISKTSLPLYSENNSLNNDARLEKSRTLYENYSQRYSTPTSSKEAPPEGILSVPNTSLPLYTEKNYVNNGLEMKFPIQPVKTAPEKEFDFMKKLTQLKEGTQELVRITHMVDPDNFFVLRASDEKTLNKMMANVQENLMEITHRVSVGDLCMVYYDGSWMRCRVESVDQIGTSNPTYQVLCLDFGFTASVTIDSLRTLRTSTFASSLSRGRHSFAIKCRLANCKPKNGVWTTEDIDLVNTIIENGQVILHVQRVGESSDCDVTTLDGVSLAHALVFHGRAVLEDHDLPYPVIGAIAEKPMLFMSNNNLKLKVTENVVLTHVENPEQFFVRPSYLQKDFLGLCDDLNQEYDLGVTFGSIYLPENDMLCVVHIDTELDIGHTGWKRAIVKSFDEGFVTVFLPDIGNTVEVKWNRLRRIHKKFTALRGLACECYLVGIAPYKKGWCEQATAFMNIYKECALKLCVYNQQKRSAVGAVLITESENEKVCINQEMINCGLAVDTGTFDFDLLKPKTVKSKPVKKPSKESASVAKAMSPEKPLPKVTKKDHDGPLRLEAKVLRYESPSLMYISLVQQQKLFSKLFEDIQKFYALNDKRQIRRSNWKVNDRCCVLCIQSETWRRATIVAVEKDKVTVFYTDFACTETVPVSHLRKLHPNFEKMGDCAMKCHLVGVIPAASNEWPTITNEFLKEKLDSYSRVFMTKVGQFKDKSMPVELWVYHTIQGSALEPDESDWRSLSQVIIDQGLGLPDKNYQPAARSSANGDDETLSFFNLTGSVNDWLQVPRMQFTPLDSSDSGASSPMKMGFDGANDNTLFISDWLPAEPLKSDKFTGVPTYIDNDAIIYLYDVTQLEVLELIRDSLEMAFKADDPKSRFCTWRVGEPCIARYYLDNNFYRGKVLEVNKEESNCLVLYVDYGNHEVCPFSDLRKGIALHQIPVQAHKCSLSRIKPKSDKWDLNILDYIHKAIVEKKCFVKVAGETIDDITPIDLKYDKLWINDHLVEFEMASYTDGSKPLVLKYSPDTTKGKGKGKGKDKVFKEKEIEQVIRVDCDGEPDYIVEETSNSSEEYKSLDSFKMNVPINGTFITYPKHEQEEFDCNIAVINSSTYLELNIIQDTESNVLYEELFEAIDKEGKDLPFLDGIFENKACIALFPQDNKWYRASILQHSESKNLIKVRYVDYGNIEVIPVSDAREISEEWATLPPSSISVQLNGVKANPDLNPEDVTSAYVETFLDKNPFHAKIIDYKDSVPHVELRNNEQKLVYQNLIECGILLYDNE